MSNKKNRKFLEEKNLEKEKISTNGEEIEDLYKNSLKVIDHPKRYSFLPVIFLILIISLLVSFVFQIAINSGLLNNWSIFKDLKIFNANEAPVYKTVEQYYIRENDYLATINERLSPLIVNIFTAPEKKSEELKDQLYLPNKKKAVATILTSDGWLVSAGNFNNEKENYVAVTPSG